MKNLSSQPKSPELKEALLEVVKESSELFNRPTQTYAREKSMALNARAIALNGLVQLNLGNR